MTQKTPRIVSIGIGSELYWGRRAIVVGWADTPALSSEVDLSGWIKTGGSVLAPLSDFRLFEKAEISDFGDAIFWGDPDGDLAIDAVHLQLLAEQQAPMSSDEVSAWQAFAGISNAEAADALGVVPSTWARYKSGGEIPTAVAIAIRAAKRDPLILQARLRPKVRGRRGAAFADHAFANHSFAMPEDAAKPEN